MAYEVEMRRTGTWLFRWRSYVPLAVLALIVVELRHFEYLGGSHRLDIALEIACLLVGSIGLAIRAHVVGHAPADTSGRNTERGQVAAVLNTTGLYSVVRNPLYFGNFFLWIGCAMYLHDWRIIAIAWAGFFIAYERIVMAEEAFLEQRFGDEYRAWAARTPAFLPRLRGYVRPSLPFSLRNVLKREHAGAFAFVALLYLFEILGEWIYNGRPMADTGWHALFAVSATLYVALRIAKKHTRLLHVPGR